MGAFSDLISDISKPWGQGLQQRYLHEYQQDEDLGQKRRLIEQLGPLQMAQHLKQFEQEQQIKQRYTAPEYGQFDPEKDVVDKRTGKVVRAGVPKPSWFDQFFGKDFEKAAPGISNYFTPTEAGPPEFSDVPPQASVTPSVKDKLTALHRMFDIDPSLSQTRLNISSEGKPSLTLGERTPDRLPLGWENFVGMEAYRAAMAKGQTREETLRAGKVARDAAIHSGSFERGAGSALGANSPAARAAKGETAFTTGKRGAEGGVAGQLTETPGQPGVPGAEAVAAAKTMGAGLPQETQDVLTGFANLDAVAQQITTGFTPEEIDRFVGFAKRPLREWGQIMANDPRFAEFAMLTNQMKNYAFELGGKQLTPFEAQTVFGFVPTGSELSVADFMAKLKGVRDRVTRIKNERVKVATTTRGELRREAGAPAKSAPRQGAIKYDRFGNRIKE